MQTIITKYLAPTNYKGSRIKAMQSARGFNGERPKSITRSRDYALNDDENHSVVAKEFADKMGWKGNWIGGSNSGGGYVFVNASWKNDRNSFTCNNTKPSI